MVLEKDARSPGCQRGVDLEVRGSPSHLLCRHLATTSRIQDAHDCDLQHGDVDELARGRLYQYASLASD